jgi:hypothetical protein
LLHPEVAFRDCQDCMKHVYDEKTGRKVERRGKSVARHPKCPPPCRSKAGCPKGAPTGEKGCRELSSKNWRAYQHYKECVAVGDFPKDATVRRNAAIIRMAEESVEETKRAGSIAPLLGLMGKNRDGR